MNDRSDRKHARKEPGGVGERRDAGSPSGGSTGGASLGDPSGSSGEGRDLPPPSGLLRPEEGAELARELRAQGLSIVFTNGCFDLVHPGHVLYLEDAARLGDRLIVGLNSDASVRRLKGSNRPWLSLHARATVLLGLRSVHRVVVFDEDTPKELIDVLRPDVLCKGADYSLENVVGRETVEAGGGRVVLIPFVEGFSSSSLIEEIRRS